MKIFNSYFWEDLYYRHISCRIRPRNKWLTNCVPKTYLDKDSLIEIILFKCLTEYCEVEIGLDWLFNPEYDKNYPAHQVKFEKELVYNYKLLKEELPKLQIKLRELREEWDKIPFISLDGINSRKYDYNKTYGKIEVAENKIEKLKMKICLWIVANKGSMWT